MIADVLLKFVFMQAIDLMFKLDDLNNLFNLCTKCCVLLMQMTRAMVITKDYTKIAFLLYVCFTTAQATSERQIL